MSKWIQAKAFVRHFSQSLTPYDMHAPFLYDFTTRVLTDKRYFNAYGEIQAIRSLLLKNAMPIHVEDRGAGSKKLHATERRICDIAKTSLTNEKFGRLLFRMVHYYAPGQVLELGTSLGISALYLARASSQTTVTTIEGSTSIAQVAGGIFKQAQAENIRLITGNFSDVLPRLFSGGYRPDLVYIDGNHRLKPTLEYFDACLAHAAPNCIFIFDDIHWSAEMEEAWRTVMQHDQSRLTIDLFYKGIVFTDAGLLSKQNVCIRF